MSALTFFGLYAAGIVVIAACLVCFAWIREQLNECRAAAREPLENDLGARIDDALLTYSLLLDGGCRDVLIMEIARDRVEQLRREYEDLQVRKFNAVVK
jgi:hypothetical protein